MGTRVFRAEEGFEPVDLLKYARGHLYSAEVLFGTAFQSFDSAGHLAHLAIELLLKAAILHASGSFPGEHDLGRLLKTAANAGLSFQQTGDLEGVLFLLDGFKESRYPNPLAPVQIGNADLPGIQKLWNALLAQLPSDLRDAWEQADHITKGGRVLMVRDDSKPGATPSGPRTT